MTRERLLQDRFWNKVNKSDGCWEWAANRNTSGYGRFRLNGRMEVAHRVAYTLAVVRSQTVSSFCTLATTRLA